jgi:hypothetical protein
MPCSPGMRACHRRCLHRQLVHEYRTARHAAELAREAGTLGYATEEALAGPLEPTFRQWLEGHAIPPEERMTA